MDLLTTAIGKARREDGNTQIRSHGTKSHLMSLQIGVTEPLTTAKVGENRATPRGREQRVSPCAAMMARITRTANIMNKEEAKA